MVSPSWARGFDLLRAGVGGLLGESAPHGLRFPEPVQLRYQGKPVTPERLARIRAEQAPGRDVLVLLHGLMYDETCWNAPRFNMTAALERDFPLFTVHVRYDSGRHVSENGLELARLLESWFQAAGPSPGRLHFVAHSMGGLVTRSALHQAREAGMAFPGAVDRVILLAAPNRGAPLEKGVQALQILLQAAPHPLRITAQGLRLLFDNLRVGDRTPLSPVADITDFYVHTLPAFYIQLASRILPLRSDGILDLRHGYLLRQEWEQPQSLGGLKPRKLLVPPLPGARYFALAGALSRNPHPEPCAWVTDGMISTASAANRGKDDELRFLENGRYRLVPGINHFIMPMSPEVYEVLREWFSSSAE